MNTQGGPPASRRPGRRRLAAVSPALESKTLSTQPARTPAVLLLLLLFTLPAHAATFRVFGSAGAESQRTPANEASPLNPHNIADIPMQTNVADFSLFTEAATESRAWKVRLKLRGDASDRADEHLTVGEAFVQIRATQWLDLSAGRVIEKWGTGYGWSPTAFAGPTKNPNDPNDRRSQYSGIEMLRAGLFIKNTSVSLYALNHGAFAARAYRLIGGTDVSVAWRHDRDGSRAGISASRVVGDALEIHAEAARIGAVTQVVAGAQYTIGDTNVVAEIYHGTDGLTRGEWNAFREAAPDDLRTANHAYAPLKMARTYSLVRVFHDFAPWKTDAELVAITSLRDGSVLLRASVTRRIRPSVSAYLIATEFFGGAESELAFIQVTRVTTLGVRVHF